MLVGTSPRRVAVVGGSRIPFARAHGAYAGVGNQEMLTAALKAVVDRHALKGVRLGELPGPTQPAGQELPEGQGAQGRQVREEAA